MSDTMSIARNTPFPATAWTQIEAAKGEGNAARDALHAMCKAYYEPVFGFIVRRIPDSHRAQDLTNEFFARLLETHTVIDKADRSRGKFRSYLSQRLKWFLMEQFKKEKKKSSIRFEILDDQNDSHRKVLPVEQDPEQDDEFKSEWARRTRNQALDLQERQYLAAGNERRAQVLAKRRTAMKSKEIAAALNTNLDTIKNELKAIKRESEDCLRKVVRATVSDDSMVDEEMEEIHRLLAPKEHPLTLDRFRPA